MDKFIIRISVLSVAFYLILCYVAEFIWQINLWRQTYCLLFEYCVCLCISKQGVYHCRFIKWTAYGILISDTIVNIDNLFDIFPVCFITLLPPIIIIIGLSITTILAIKHFVKVRRLKRIWTPRVK